MAEEDEVIEVVDSSGKFIKLSKRGEVYEKGMLHKAVNIVLFTPKGKIYIQRRSSSKKSYPDFWDISVAEHLKPRESYKDAAVRGLSEELSIKTPIFKIREPHMQENVFIKDEKKIIENELSELYAGIYEGKITIDPNEVSEITEMSLEDAVKIQDFAPWGYDEINFLVNNPQIIADLKL